MHHLKTSFLFLCTLFLLSCGNFSEITLGDISGVSVKGFEDNALIIELKLPVENPTMHRITVTDFDTKIFMNNQYLGKLNTKDPIVIKAKSTEVKDLVLEVRFSNFFGAAMNIINIQKGQKVLFKIEGEVLARSLLIRKKIAINESQEIVF
jgi:LEA14-like dessication related protein